MRVYVHDAGGARVIDADPSAKLRDVTGAEMGAEIWAEDAAEPFAADATVALLADHDVAAIHVGKGQIHVTVNFNGDTRAESFGPGTKIDKVLDWAIGPKGFDVPGGDREDLVLRRQGSTEPLHADTHIGTLAGNGDSLALDLVPSDRFAG